MSEAADGAGPVDEPHATDTAAQRRTVAVLSGAQVLTGLGVGAGIAAGSLLVAEITGTEGLAGLAQTSGVLGAAVAAGPLAWLSTRRGRRVGLATGLWLAATGALVVITGAVLEWVPVILIGTFGVGVASAVGYQARYAASDLASPRHVARDLAFVVWGTTVGAVLGPNLLEPASRLADVVGLPPLSGPYLVTVSAVALAAIVVLGLLRPDPLLEARRLAVTDAATEQELEHVGMMAELARGWRVVRSAPGAVAAVTAIAIGHVVMVMVMVMTPVHMQHVDVGLELIGLVISVHVLGMYALSPLVGWMADRTGDTAVIWLGVGLLAAATAISGTASGHHTVQLGVGLFLLGLGWSCTLIGGSVLLSASVPAEHRPAAQGVGDALMNVSAGVGGAAAGVIVLAGSYAWLNLTAAACLLPLGLVLLRYRSGAGGGRRVAGAVRTPVR